jgi:hypothetical protein
MRVVPKVAVLSLLAGFTLASAGEPEIIGRVKTLQGQATVTRGDATTPAAAGTGIAQNDVLQTGPDGSVGVTFKDGSRIALGPKSRVVVDEYVYAPREQNVSFITRVTQGTLYYVSGTIAKLAPEKTSVVTPDGTVGIRGTRFLVKVADDRS